MQAHILSELERLTLNATHKREELLHTGLKKIRRRKALTIIAGVLALTSAGTIATVIAHVFGTAATQLVAAFTAAVSGIASLLTTSYYSDDEIVAMLLGSAKYLSLRENVYRLVNYPGISDADRFARLAELQDQYAQLDETYSRYLSYKRSWRTGGGTTGGTTGPPVGDTNIDNLVGLAVDKEYSRFKEAVAGELAADSNNIHDDPGSD